MPAASGRWVFAPRLAISRPARPRHAYTATPTPISCRTAWARPTWRMGGPRRAMVQAPDVSTPVSPDMPAPPGAPGGVVPTTGEQISAVVHSGPGTQGLLAIAGLLDTQAAELEQAAATVRAAGSETTSSWNSGAAEAAEAHLVGLESSYSDQAIQARSLASQMRGHADDFARAKAVIRLRGCSTTCSGVCRRRMRPMRIRRAWAAIPGRSPICSTN